MDIDPLTMRHHSYICKESIGHVIKHKNILFQNIMQAMIIFLKTYINKRKLEDQTCDCNILSIDFVLSFFFVFFSLVGEC